VSVIGSVHGRLVHTRRVAVLAGLLAPNIPQDAKVLDIGCGAGELALALMRLRPDLRIVGADVLVRPGAHIEVTPITGDRLPFADGAFDFALLVDVLHHADDALSVMREAARVSGGHVLIKDHLADRPLAVPVLAFMDWVGNAPHGVSLPYNYWRHAQWESAFATLGWRVRTWNTHVPLYVPPLQWLFGTGLHFVAALERA